MCVFALFMFVIVSCCFSWVEFNILLFSVAVCVGGGGEVTLYAMC